MSEIKTYAESAESLAAASNTFTSPIVPTIQYVQAMCLCGHPEHAGLTCNADMGTAGFCRCSVAAYETEVRAERVLAGIEAKPIVPLTFGWLGGKQPFKCPVCLGSGRTHPLFSSDMSGIPCHACKESGVVWGPP